MIFEYKHIIDQFNKHKFQIRRGGIKLLIIKIINALLRSHKLIYYLLSFIVLICLIVLSNFKKIRLGRIRTDKIGSFSVLSELYLSDSKNLKNTFNKEIVVFFREKNICNKYLFKLIKKKIIIFPNIIFSQLYQLLILFNLKQFIYERKYGDIDHNYSLSRTGNQIRIPQEDYKDLKSLFKILGIKKKDKIICLTVRDNAFHGKSELTEYRNVKINNYKSSIMYLIKKGYFVLRMGRKTNTKINIKNKKFIDYSKLKYRNDKLDILIASKSSFCISTGTGFDGIIRMFRKPTLFTNYAPIVYFPSDIFNSQIIFKKLYDKKSMKKNKYLSLKDIIRSGLAFVNSDREFKNRNVKLIDNSSNEILQSVIEFEKKFIKNKRINTNLSNLDKKFNKIFNKELKYCHISVIHKRIHATVSNHFLKKNQFI